MKQREIFTEKYWNRFFLRMLMYTAVVAISVITIGVLALPVAMAVLYSGWFLFLFLYLVYLVCVLLVVAIYK
ncbi:MAG: hypothetical protein PHS82_03220 [Lachnospiraceae bacterium]|nr:hypothetical protein [Lachnospiraceae bacterium]